MSDGRDLSYFYAARLGESQILAVGASAVQSTVLPPGRYLMYPVDLAGGSGRCWVRQGNENVAATADAPSTLMGVGALTAVEFVARQAPNGRPGLSLEYLSVIADAGVSGELHIVRISR